MKTGRPVQMDYDTRFLIRWPDHLGSGTVELDLDGTMVLHPLLTSR